MSVSFTPSSPSRLLTSLGPSCGDAGWLAATLASDLALPHVDSDHPELRPNCGRIPTPSVVGYGAARRQFGQIPSSTHDSAISFGSADITLVRTDPRLDSPPGRSGSYQLGRPDAAAPPCPTTISPRSSADSPIITLAITSPSTAAQLINLTGQHVEPRLSEVTGVRTRDHLRVGILRPCASSSTSPDRHYGISPKRAHPLSSVPMRRSQGSATHPPAYTISATTRSPPRDASRNVVVAYRAAPASAQSYAEIARLETTSVGGVYIAILAIVSDIQPSLAPM